MNTETDEEFIADLKNQLEQDESRIDGATQSQLTQARYAALEQLDTDTSKSWKFPAFTTATLASIALAITVFVSVNTKTGLNPTNDANSNDPENGFVMSEYEYTAFIDSSDPLFGISNESYSLEEAEFHQWLDNMEDS